MASKPTVEVTLISGRRPALLDATLSSFHKNLFAHCTVSRFIANIDPFGGSAQDQKSCVELIRSYFPDAEIFEPLTPSFGGAVQRVWQASTGPVLFHLEDDWLLLEPLDVEKCLGLFTEQVAVLKFVSKEHGWTPEDGPYLKGRVSRKWLGMRLGKRTFNKHGLSPGFFLGPFVRKWASMIHPDSDPDLDPEKQARPGVNQALFEYVDQFTCKMLPGQRTVNLIEDIGRQWRDNQGLVKRVHDGKSTWERG